MLKKIILSILLISCSFLSKSQEYGDSLMIQKLLDSGQFLIYNQKFKEASEVFEAMKVLAKEGDFFEQYFTGEQKLIEILIRKNQLDLAEQRALASRAKARSLLTPSSTIEMKFLVYLGALKHEKAEVDSAIYYYSQAAEMGLEKEFENNKARLMTAGVALGNIGISYGILGDVKMEYDYTLRAYEINRKALGEGHISLANNLNVLGNVLSKKSQFKRALSSYNESLAILESNNVKGRVYKNVLLNIGVDYTILGEYDKGADFLIKSLNYTESIFGTIHPDLMEINVALIQNMERRQLYDSAKYFFNKASLIAESMKADGTIKTKFRYVGVMYRELAIIESKTGNEEQAESLLKDAISLIEGVDSNHYVIDTFKQDLADLYVQQEKYTKAENLLNSIIANYKQSFGETSQRLILPYIKLAKLYRVSERYDLALQNIDNSISCNLIDAEISPKVEKSEIETVLNKLRYFESLYEKSKVLEAKFRLNNSYELLADLNEIYSILNKVIVWLRGAFNSQADKENIQSNLSNIYDQAIQVNFNAFQNNLQQDFIQKCFAYSEANKANILFDAIRKTEAKKWSGIPAELINFEEDKKSDLVFYRTKLNAELANKGELKKTDEIAKYQSLIFDLKKSLDSISLILETQHPEYFELKYKNDEVLISDVQALLQKNEVLIEYALGDSASYAFLISREQVQMKMLDRRIDLQAQIAILNQQLNRMKTSAGLESFDLLDQTSHLLYTTLLKPFEKELNEAKADKLTIIPDAELGYLPFELLLTEPVSEKRTNYARYPYLLQKYDISYAYSASLLFDESAQSTTEATSFISYAPAYENTSGEQVALRSLGKFRDAFVDLKWNGEEAKSISKYFKNDAKIGAFATEKNFKENAKDARILHLAMHAFVDDEEPMNSKLVFYQDKDSIEDGFLHTFELYNMRLNAEMAVLSACETGYGKLINGEGIISLARGFAYAGVPSVVMSHWQVDDESTKDIMELFYKNLSEGQSKSSALRHAKLSYLETAKPGKKHPFFWSAFVIIGDDSPIGDKGMPVYYWFIALAAVLLAVMIVIRSKKQRAA